MKRPRFYFITTIFIVLFNVFAPAQTLNWVQEQDFNDAGWHFGVSVSRDKNDNIYYTSIYRGTEDAKIISGTYILKYNKDGKLIWKIYKRAAEAQGITSDNDGNIYITGTFQYTLDFGCTTLKDSALNTFFIAKLDSNGNCLWAKMVRNAVGKSLVLDKSEKSF